MSDKILIVGATGLIGGHIVQQMVSGNRDKHLHLLLRRKYSRESGAAQVHIDDPENWLGIIAQIKPDIVISALGSTMKKAGSKEAFAAIDRDLVTTVAVAAKKAGAKQFIAVSSTMADSNASSFYLKVKGQAEDRMRAQSFDRLDIIRPGLLRGERTDDWRLGESLAVMVSPLLDKVLQGSLRRYRSIAAGDVAKAILSLVGQGAPGVFVHENDEIWRLGR